MKKLFSLKELATLTGCRLVGNPQHIISGCADLESATSHDASFYANPRYQRMMKDSKAGVIFIDTQTDWVEGKNFLIAEQPSRAFQQLIDTLRPARISPSGFKGIHPSAVIHPTAQLEKDVSIGPHTVIDEGVKIGSCTFVGAGVYIGPDSFIGHSCLIHPHVVIREGCQIGDRVIIQPGAVIGSCGFGYTTDKQGHHTKLNQVGDVVIKNDVEIGANATIDRARLGHTTVGEGSKLDNLVQLGHNVTLGAHNIVAAQTGIAGSTSTENLVIIGGQVGIVGHLHIEEGISIAAKSGVTKSLANKTGNKYGGIPAVPLHQYNQNQVFLRNIQIYIDQLKDLADRIEQLENQK